MNWTHICFDVIKQFKDIPQQVSHHSDFYSFAHRSGNLIEIQPFQGCQTCRQSEVVFQNSEKLKRNIKNFYYLLVATVICKCE